LPIARKLHVPLIHFDLYFSLFHTLDALFSSPPLCSLWFLLGSHTSVPILSPRFRFPPPFSQTLLISLPRQKSQSISRNSRLALSLTRCSNTRAPLYAEIGESSFTHPLHPLLQTVLAQKSCCTCLLFAVHKKQLFTSSDSGFSPSFVFSTQEMLSHRRRIQFTEYCFPYTQNFSLFC